MEVEDWGVDGFGGLVVERDWFDEDLGGEGGGRVVVFVVVV